MAQGTAEERQLLGYEVLYTAVSTTVEDVINRQRIVHASLANAIDAGLTVAVEAAEALEHQVRVVPAYEDSRRVQRQLGRGESVTLFVLENYSNECMGSVAIYAVWAAADAAAAADHH